MTAISAYTAILDTLDANAGVLDGDPAIDIRAGLRARIKIQEISDDFGIEIKDKDGPPHWIKVNEYSRLCLMGEAHGRTIAWSDDDRQPVDEWLLAICFPTGGYIFGEDYPKETFTAFFEELASLNPDYLDTANHCLYFGKERAGHAFTSFGGVFEKYRALAKEERDRNKIAELKRRLKELTGD